MMRFVSLTRRMASVVVGILAILLAGGTVTAGTLNMVEWIGPSFGNWHVAVNWDPMIVPDNSVDQYHAVIDNGGDVQASLSGSATVSALTIGPNNGVHISNSSQLFLANTGRSAGVVNNAGVLRIASSGAHTSIRMLGGPVTLTGGGVVELTNSAGNWIYREDADSSLVNEDNTIRGAGNLGWSDAPMSITNRGTIEATGTVPLAMNVGTFVNEGTIHVIGSGGITGGTGTFTTSGDITVDATRKFARSGAVTQTGGSTSVAGEFELSGTNVFEIAGGVLNGAGIVDADVLNSGGSVEPGASIGLLTVQGAFAQTLAGALTVELENVGTPGVDYDQLAVDGNATLAGQLRLESFGGYLPSIGDTFTVVTADAISGGFDTVIPCGTYQVSYTPTNVIVEVVGAPPVMTCGGDTVSSATFQPPPDGLVDAADLAFLLGQWGAGLSCADTVTSATFAPPPDGTVDAADLALLLGNWGPCD